MTRRPYRGLSRRDRELDAQQYAEWAKQMEPLCEELEEAGKQVHPVTPAAEDKAGG